MPTNLLSDRQCSSTKPGPRPIRCYDGEGLYLEIRPTGARLWRLKYRFGGKEKLLALGAYPSLSLAAARERRAEAKRDLAQGVDPSAKRRALRLQQELASNSGLEAVAREWHAKQAPKWAPTHSAKVLHRLEKNVFPWLGDRPVGELEAPEVLKVLQRMEARGVLDSTRRVRQYLTAIFRYAIATRRAKYNPAADLVGATASPIRKSYAAITDSKKLCRHHRSERDCPALARHQRL